MAKKKIHIVLRFIAGIAITKCGLFENTGTAYRKESNCKSCRRSRKQ